MKKLITEITKYLSLNSIPPLVEKFFPNKEIKKTVQIDLVNVDLVVETNSILKYLGFLIEGFNYAGKFCPRTEAHCPNLSLEKKPNHTSYAERAFQFRNYGEIIISCCTNVTFKIPKEEMPKSYKAITKIINFLTKHKADSATNLEAHLQYMISYLSDDRKLEMSSKCRNFSKDLEKLHTKLTMCLKKEFPYLKKA